MVFEGFDHRIIYIWNDVFQILRMEKTEYFLDYINLGFTITPEIQTIAREYTQRDRESDD